MSALFKLRGPCSNCPFRGDGQGVGHLRPERCQEIRQTDRFNCHKTTRGGERSICGGWLAMCWRHDSGFHGLIALAARLGVFNPDDLQVDRVWPSWRAWFDFNERGR